MMEEYVILKFDDNDKPAINNFFRNCLITYSQASSVVSRVLVFTKQGAHHRDMDYQGRLAEDDLACFETNPRKEYGAVNYYFRITEEEAIITNAESLLWFFKRIGILELEQVKQNPERELEILRMMNDAHRRLSVHYLEALDKMRGILNDADEHCSNMWKNQNPILDNDSDSKGFKLTRIFSPNELDEMSEDFWKVAYQKQENEGDEKGWHHREMLKETMLEFCKAYNEREYGN